MRLAPRARSLRLAALVVLIASIPQTTNEPSGASSRSFQMALLTYPYLTGFSWRDTAAHVDVGVFVSDNPGMQPEGPSVMILHRSDSAFLSNVAVDWSRILAVLIDEPYVTALADDDRTNPACARAVDPRRGTVRDIFNSITSAASTVHATAPRTRVWVNFHQWEVAWMRDSSCPAVLNDASIDVVSLDKYEVDFANLEDDYAWFASAWPRQQVALVPATAYRSGGDSAEEVAARLQGYFDYANGMNQRCDMELGRVGRTGNYDGCRVWIVAGWSAEPAFPYDGGWYSLFWRGSSAGPPSGAPILDRWTREINRAPR